MMMKIVFIKYDNYDVMMMKTIDNFDDDDHV